MLTPQFTPPFTPMFTPPVHTSVHTSIPTSIPTAISTAHATETRALSEARALSCSRCPAHPPFTCRKYTLLPMHPSRAHLPCTPPFATPAHPARMCTLPSRRWPMLRACASRRKHHPRGRASATSRVARSPSRWRVVGPSDGSTYVAVREVGRRRRQTRSSGRLPPDDRVRTRWLCALCGGTTPW